MEQKIEVGSTVCSKSGYIRKGVVQSFLPQSRTMVNVKDTDRGSGWNEREQKYTGVTHRTKNQAGAITSSSWSRGQNYTYGENFERHINQLNIIQ